MSRAREWRLVSLESLDVFFMFHEGPLERLELESGMC